MAELPVFSGNILGTIPGKKGYPGRPVLEHQGGEGYSTHFNMVTNINGKEYIIPTIFGGKLHDENTAIGIAKKNNFIDPDTGEAFPSFNTPEEALAHEELMHPILDQKAQQAITQKHILDTIQWPYR